MMRYDLIDELYRYDKYESGQIYIIDSEGKDHTAKSLFSYGQWLKEWKWQIVKAEGLEDTDIPKRINFPHKVKNIHLFYHGVEGLSFKEHSDDIDVYLYVDCGKKYVHMNDNVYTISKGEGIHIPKGVMHKVESEKDTWALSIGYYE